MKVESPESPILSAEGNLDPDDVSAGSIILTVHRVEGVMVGNVWLKKSNGVCDRILEERIDAQLDGKPGKAYDMLPGELLRWVMEKAEEQTGNPQFENPQVELMAKVRDIVMRERAADKQGP